MVRTCKTRGKSYSCLLIPCTTTTRPAPKATLHVLLNTWTRFICPGYQLLTLLAGQPAGYDYPEII